jgi:hypothetical protein
METYNNVPQTNKPQESGFSIINLIVKICGGLAVVFLMFLPVAGCERTNDYNTSGLDILKGLFNSRGEIDVSTVLFFLSISCGIVIAVLRKPLLFIIFAAAGIITFLSAYFYVKSKNQMDMLELKIGAFLAIMTYIAVIVLSIIKMTTGNKSAVTQPLPQSIPPPQNIQQQPYVQPQYTPPPPPVSQQQNSQYQPQQQPIQPKFCSKCGNKFPENFQGNFCTSCGTKVIK